MPRRSAKPSPSAGAAAHACGLSRLRGHRRRHRHRRRGSHREGLRRQPQGSGAGAQRLLRLLVIQVEDRRSDAVGREAFAARPVPFAGLPADTLSHRLVDELVDARIMVADGIVRRKRKAANAAAGTAPVADVEPEARVARLTPRPCALPTSASWKAGSVRNGSWPPKNFLPDAKRHREPAPAMEAQAQPGSIDPAWSVSEGGERTAPQLRRRTANRTQRLHRPFPCCAENCGTSPTGSWPACWRPPGRRPGSACRRPKARLAEKNYAVATRWIR